MKRHLSAGLSAVLAIIAIAGPGLAGAKGSAGNLGEAIPHIPVLDGFGRQEVPLANGKWTKTAELNT